MKLTSPGFFFKEANLFETMLNVLSADVLNSKELKISNLERVTAPFFTLVDIVASIDQDKTAQNVQSDL